MSTQPPEATRTEAAETLEQTFSVSGIPTVHLSNVRGLVTVQPGEDGVVKVVAVKRADSGSARHTTVEMNQDADGQIRIKTKYYEAGRWFFGFGQPCKVDYTLTVPRAANLTVKTVSSETSVRGLSGELTLKSVSGPIIVADLSGTLNFESVSGRISGGQISGPLVVKTVSGNVELRQSNLPTLQAASVSGGLELDTPLGTGPYHLKTVSGSAKIHLPAPSGGRIHFKSVSGRARIEQPVAGGSGNDFPQGGPRREVIDLPGSGPEIHFNSVSGDLNLDAPGGAVAAAPAQVKTLDILERVASGEMTVDAALQAMGAA